MPLLADEAVESWNSASSNQTLEGLATETFKGFLHNLYQPRYTPTDLAVGIGATAGVSLIALAGAIYGIRKYRGASKDAKQIHQAVVTQESQSLVSKEIVTSSSST